MDRQEDDMETEDKVAASTRQNKKLAELNPF